MLSSASLATRTYIKKFEFLNQIIADVLSGLWRYMIALNWSQFSFSPKQLLMSKLAS